MRERILRKPRFAFFGLVAVVLALLFISVRQVYAIVTTGSGTPEEPVVSVNPGVGTEATPMVIDPILEDAGISDLPDLETAGTPVFAGISGSLDIHVASGNSGLVPILGSGLEPASTVATVNAPEIGSEASP